MGEIPYDLMGKTKCIRFIVLFINAVFNAALRHDQLKSGVILAHQIKALKMVATIPMACCACDHFFGLIVDHTAGSLKHTLLVVIPEKHLDIGQTVLFQRPIHHLKKAFLFLSCEHTGIPGLPGFWLILE
jgi:hypothetical protein